MKLSKTEYDHVMKYVSKFPVTELRFKVTERLELQGIANRGYELAVLADPTLRRLYAFLPSDRLKKLHSPYLARVRHKTKQTLVHKARPHLDPAHWPKVFRNLNNNDRAGLRDFGGGQLGVLHDRALAVELTGRFVWNERKFGDLLIMGPWTDIASAIGKGSGLSFEMAYEDIYAGDVNVEFDRMYTDEKIPEDDRGFYVTHMQGAAFETTDQEGHVVADPRGELFELGAGAVAGLAGGAANFTGTLEVIDVAKGVFETGVSMGQNLGVKLKGSGKHRDMHTFIVSVLPSKRHDSVKTGKKSLSGREFLRIARRLAGVH